MANKTKRSAARPTRRSQSGGQADPAAQTKTYSYPTETAPLRPDIGTQAQFRKRKEPVRYRYDSSLSPALDWDGQNPAREQDEARIARAEQELAGAKKNLADTAEPKPEQIDAAKAHLAAAQEAIRELKAMSKPSRRNFPLS